MDRDVARAEPLLDRPHQRGDSTKVGEIGRERYGFDTGVCEFGDALFERTGTARDERYAISFAPVPIGEGGSETAAGGEHCGFLLVSHHCAHGVVCFDGMMK